MTRDAVRRRVPVGALSRGPAGCLHSTSVVADAVGFDVLCDNGCVEQAVDDLAVEARHVRQVTSHAERAASSIERITRMRWVVIVILGLLASTACRSRQEFLSEQEKELTSLRATAVAVGEAWLAGA